VSSARDRQRLQQIAQREAGIDDVLDQQHVLAFDCSRPNPSRCHHAGEPLLFEKLEMARKSILIGTSMCSPRPSEKISIPFNTPTSFERAAGVLPRDLGRNLADARRGSASSVEQDSRRYREPRAGSCLYGPLGEAILEDQILKVLLIKHLHVQIRYCRAAAGPCDSSSVTSDCSW